MYGEMRALTRFRVDFKASAQTGDLAFNHVHANAAPGQFGDFFRGGKSRCQYELHHLCRCQGHFGL